MQQYILSLGAAVSPEQQAQIAAYWGADTPPFERYISWLAGVLRGDLGQSALYRRPVADIIGERFLNSLALMLCAWILAGILGFALGCVMGMYKDRLPDKILKKICYILSSVPTFWLGLVLLLVFSVGLGWFPIGFSRPIGLASGEVTIWQRLCHLVLPSLTLSFTSFSNIALHTRQKLIGVLNSEYVLFARARGRENGRSSSATGCGASCCPPLPCSFPPFPSSSEAPSWRKMYSAIRAWEARCPPQG